MIKHLFFYTLLLLPFCSLAISLDKVRFHNEATDTTKISKILIEASEIRTDKPQERVDFIARQFLGTPYVAHTLEDSIEMLTINLDELDCTTFVETVIALAYTIGEYRTSWRDYVYNLERIRYRDGAKTNYASRLHYICDWVINNTHRGMFIDATPRLPKCDYAIKSIDFMSKHRDSYPALSDSATFAAIKQIEIGYRNHRFPYIKKEDIKNKEVINALRPGDLVALTTNVKGLDVSHLGIITFVDGVPHLLHASMKAGEVIIDPLPLGEYLRRSRSLTGIRVIRLND